MKRLHNLQHLIQDLEELLANRLRVEQAHQTSQFEQLILKTTQKISLAEKRADVKNTRSYKSSEV